MTRGRTLTPVEHPPVDSKSDLRFTSRKEHTPCENCCPFKLVRFDTQGDGPCTGI